MAGGSEHQGGIQSPCLGWQLLAFALNAHPTGEESLEKEQFRLARGAAATLPPESGQHSSIQTVLIHFDKNQSPWVLKESKALLNQMINYSF